MIDVQQEGPPPQFIFQLLHKNNVNGSQNKANVNGSQNKGQNT